MRYEPWDFENDMIITDADLMFPSNSARKYMGTAYAVETTHGIFYQKMRPDGDFDLIHVDKSGEHIFEEDVVIVASDMNYTCIIVHYNASGEYYLIDTRGTPYLLEISKEYVGPSAYQMNLDRVSGFYEVGKNGNVRWMLRGISKQKQFAIMMESAPSFEWSLNPKFKSLFSKKNAGLFFYLTIPGGKKGQLINRILTCGLPYEVIPNIFTEDTTCNIRIPINEVTKGSKALHFLMAKYADTYTIAGIPMEVFMGTLELDRKARNQLGVSFKRASDSQYPKVKSLIATLKILYSVETDMDVYKKVFKRLLGLFADKDELGFENSFTSLVLPYPNSSPYGLEDNIRVMVENCDYISTVLGYQELMNTVSDMDVVDALWEYKNVYEASKKYYKQQMKHFEDQLAEH